MNRHSQIALLTLSIIVTTFVIADDADFGLTQTTAATQKVAPTPLHEQVVQHLRSNNAAVARPLPDLHPTAPVFNREAVIPPQCYTKTQGKFNPCYVCHQNPVAGRENTMTDGELQLAYSFSDVGMTNHWKNLFEDRTERVAKISDADIDDWVSQDNYSALPERLHSANFGGWIPDLDNLQLGAAAFDQNGFAKDGSNWVAFNYKPLPSTFWPTNGSTDDVMIRLPAAYYTKADGTYSKEVYKANLAIVEANLKGLTEVTSLPIDEQEVGVDLDRNGELSIAHRVVKPTGYVGAATALYFDDYLYPENTEFLHTVRYVGVGPDGEIGVSTRMKEVRYMRKWNTRHKVAYERSYELEGFAKEEGRLPTYPLLGDRGLDNEFAWSVQGFIEGHDGELRTATYEENLFCMGCHASIGSTIDKTFSFPRKLDGREGWGYIDLRAMQDAPNVGETRGEIETYFERVGGGGEFRSNPEMYQRWFNEDGSLNRAAIRQAKSVYDLIVPSASRARELNKAYRVIVEDQDFIYGRDATVTPPENVYDFVDNEKATVLPADLFFPWDIRLDWSESPAP